MSAAQSATLHQPDAARPDVEHRDSRPMTAVALDEAGLALRKAWAIYILLALIPPGAMIAAIFTLLFTRNDTLADVPTAQQYGGFGGFWGLVWLTFGMVWISIFVPLGFFIRRAKWKAFYEGGLVSGKDYLAGWLPIWVPLVIGGVIGFVGLALTAEVGNLFTSMLSFVVFLSMAPNGHALTRPVGDHDDPGVYEEPK